VVRGTAVSVSPIETAPTGGRARKCRQVVAARAQENLLRRHPGRRMKKMPSTSPNPLTKRAAAARQSLPLSQRMRVLRKALGLSELKGSIVVEGWAAAQIEEHATA